MKKKVVQIFILFSFIFIFLGLYNPQNVKGEETKLAAYINISTYPTKTTYARGEDLDLTGMILECYYYDGTVEAITDYEIIGYDSNRLGNQSIFIKYQDRYVFLNVTVVPGKIVNVSATKQTASSLTLTWDTLTGQTRYEVYELDELTNTYVQIAVTDKNNITFKYPSGTIHSYQICAVENISGEDYRGELSDTLTTATKPEIVTDLTADDSTTSSVVLTWEEVIGATGYLIYRSRTSVSEYSLCGTTENLTFTDKKLASGTSYKYRVRAYTLDEDNTGAYSSIIKTSTNPTAVTLKSKVGNKKIRITWPKVTGASAYDIYMSSDGDEYSLLTSLTSSDSSYIIKGLKNDQIYSFYAVSQRYYNDDVYVGPESAIMEVAPTKIAKTSTVAKYFTKKADFILSSAYKFIESFQKNVTYSKSYIIPGLALTNIDGFASTSMAPQAIAFTDQYLLMTAYDMKSEENSVIYVMDKTTRKYMTTLILPSKTHAGGLAYDGSNVWVSVGTKVSSIPYAEIKKAVESNKASVYVHYNATCSLGITASYMTYYDKKLWVGSYNELNATKMYSYSIKSKKTSPSLTKVDTVNMPTRVQGVAFTKQGDLILSRSCQLYEGLRGYMRQLDVYKPIYSEAEDGLLILGDPINIVSMPSMNEGIAISGSYLYVNFESAAFSNASYIMDRICAFKLTSITEKVPEK